MKILIIGASGLLGRKLFDTLSHKYEVGGTYFSKLSQTGYHYLDITNKEQVNKFFDDIKVDVVIHTSALCDPDFCEQNRKKAKLVNVIGTKNVVEGCRKQKIKLFFISSDYIFDGRNLPYTEHSVPNPVNYYGETKLEAEDIVKQNLKNYIIIRPTVLYGYNADDDKKTFVTDVIEKLTKGEKLVVDNEIIKYPLLIDDVCSVLEELLKRNEEGVFNIGSDDPFTRYEWALKIADVFNFPKDKIKARKSRTIAKRPINVKFDTAKIKRLGIKFTDVQTGLKIIKNQKGCIFRMIYSVRPDALVLNQNASEFRIIVGRLLAKKYSAEADMVISVPETGIFSATGYADESKLPFFFGLIRDYSTQRTLFEPVRELRSEALRRKLIVVPEIVKGKSLVVVDEAILSGLTLKLVVDKLRNAGAKEIHIRIPAPPMRFNCNYKILNPAAKLIASSIGNNKKVDECKEEIEKALKRYFQVNSLKFLKLTEFLSVLKRKKDCCVECFR